MLQSTDVMFAKKSFNSDVSVKQFTSVKLTKKKSTQLCLTTTTNKNNFTNAP